MAVQCKKCGGPHPTWECTASAAKVAAFTNRGGSSAVEPRPSKPLVEGSTPSPRSKSTAARKDVRGLTTDETQGSALPAVARNLEATPGSSGAPNQTAGTQVPPVDVKSAGSNQQELPRPKEGPAVGGEVTTGLAAKPKLGRGRPLSPNPKSPRAAYQRELMRKLRAKDKADGKRRARLKAEQENQ